MGSRGSPMFWYGVAAALFTAILICTGIFIGRNYLTPAPTVTPATPLSSAVPEQVPQAMNQPQPTTSVRQSPANTPQTTPKQPDVPTSDLRQITPPNGKLITGFTGTTSASTDKFVVTQPVWKISWYTRPVNRQNSNFILYLCDEEGKTLGLVANAVGEARDEYTVRQYGVFQLKIVSEQYYEIACVVR